MDKIKARILQFAGDNEVDLAFFTQKIFGSEEFFHSTEKITALQIMDLAILFPELNMNWILIGRGRMLQSPNEILVEALEEELTEKQQEIDRLRLELKRFTSSISPDFPS